MHKAIGQVLTELALSMPLILLVIYGSAELGRLIIDKLNQDHSTMVLVEWAALHPGEPWQDVSNYLLPGCQAAVVTLPLDLIEVQVTCQHHALIYPPLAVPISSRADSNIILVASPSS